MFDLAVLAAHPSVLRNNLADLVQSRGEQEFTSATWLCRPRSIGKFLVESEVGRTKGAKEKGKERIMERGAVGKKHREERFAILLYQCGGRGEGAKEESLATTEGGLARWAPGLRPGVAEIGKLPCAEKGQPGGIRCFNRTKRGGIGPLGLSEVKGTRAKVPYNGPGKSYGEGELGVTGASGVSCAN